MQAMVQPNKWVYLILGAFVLLNGLLISQDFFWLGLLPLILLGACLFVLSLDKLMLGLAFFAPLSINIIEFVDAPVGMYLPTEPILFAIMLLVVLRFFIIEGLDRKLLKHPLTWVIALQLLWMLVTALTSFDVLVSLKFLLARLWFVLPFYVLGYYLFKNPDNIPRFIWAYVLGMGLVAIYTLLHHASFQFAHKPAHWVMSPFFNDHTSYGAMLAFFIPPLLGLLVLPGKSVQYRWGLSLVLVLFAVATVFSYTRAAWLSLVGAAFVWACMYFKIRFRTLVFVGLGLLVAGFSLWDQVSRNLEKNSQDSSDDFAEHVQSMTNVSTDASNLERLNRWDAAFSLFKARPHVGWGPGTYQFVYAPYQDPGMKTIISTNAADKGNAHSEYIGPLAEQGWPGAAIMLLLVGMVIYTGIRLYIQLEDRNLAVLAMVMVLALITYFAHGFLNNFLDTDKASIPFWGFIAALVALDVKAKKKAS